MALSDDDRTRVLEQLLVHIEQLTAQDFQLLAQIQDVDWLSPLRNLQPEVAVQEIRRLVEDSSSATVYLNRIIWFYCWLMSRQKIGPWLLFRFNVPGQFIDYNAVLGSLVRTQPPVSRPTALGVFRDQGAFYACMIRNRTSPYRRQLVVLPFVLWSGWPFVAAYVGTGDELPTLLTCLAVALRGARVEL
ncbi:hypothetical protein MTO96_033758 [Rhipicephalus appendiculatus]